MLSLDDGKLPELSVSVRKVVFVTTFGAGFTSGFGASGVNVCCKYSEALSVYLVIRFFLKKSNIIYSLTTFLIIIIAHVVSYKTDFQFFT
jgi:hypothetical protein